MPPPPPGRPPGSRQAGDRPDYVVVFDGGSLGNPGQGYGSYLITRAADRKQRLRRLEFGSHCTNNEAEYDTLIAALDDLIGRIEAAHRDPSDFTLEIRGDSMLVIRQLQGKWKVKEPRMQDRVARCLPLLRRFRAVSLHQHPRAETVRLLGH